MPILSDLVPLDAESTIEMPDDGYDGLSRGQRWGCAVALLMGASSFLFLSLLDALGDCAPNTSCEKGLWTYVLLPSIAISAIVFFVVRWVIDRQNRQ
jgi:hypothetical protein